MLLFVFSSYGLHRLLLLLMSFRFLPMPLTIAIEAYLLYRLSMMPLFYFFIDAFLCFVI